MDPTEFAYALRTLYDEGRMVTAVNSNNPALARMPREQRFGGKNHSFSVHYGGMTGRSYSFTKAQTNRNPSSGKEFLLTRSHDYAVGRIDTETILASEDDDGAILAATELEADQALIALNNSLGAAVFGNGSGKIGEIAVIGEQTTLDTTTLYLSNDGDVIHFEEGQVVVFADSEASALRDSGKTLTVSKVREDIGALIMSAKLNTISGLDYSDSIFTEGDYASASERNKVVGYDGWIPLTVASSGDSFFNVDRYVHQTRLAGYRATSTTHPGCTTYEAVGVVATMIQRGGNLSDTCYMGTDRMRKFLVEMEGKATYNKATENVELKNRDGEVVAVVGFDAIEVKAGGSTIKCFADRNCPENTIHVQKLDTWEFRSMGSVPRWVVKSMPVSDQDEIEFRAAYWGNIKCKRPVANGRYDWV